ncbi:MAG: sodium:calcium antiporter [Nitrospira sp. SB0675_bin_23]|nr:sodium:calcium antiporter [Nitrospira sp. SB0667_bin_9]MYD30580.1 sodium:calcium antiporter [Nitrospira sp. SB0661_bin_20]MYH02944.1 sodium:calcium antiporter [Nitrospira sp. SB0675_bin_23]MYJ22996.1 sodium:calcium antiporter [Nitrospira sp. SB0673_bin_12]
MELWVLLISLVVILVGAETFTNALEHFGERLHISEGVTGSVLAAVGTALPEAMIPVVAVLAASGDLSVRHDVGVGAILGAPLMLSTITLFLMGTFAAQRRGWTQALRPEPTGVHRDLSWFLFAFALATLTIFVPSEWQWARVSLALILILSYFVYLLLTIRASGKLVEQGHGTEADHPLFLSRLRVPGNLATILLQLFIGFGLIVAGAKGFVYGVEHLAAWLGLSTLALSLLIVPVATELPEKVNSIIWVRRGRDTLAFGNITGAMVFQGSLLPALGVLLTPWVPRKEALWGIGLTFLAAGYLKLRLRSHALRPYHLIFNGLCYLAFGLLIAFG